VPASQTFCSRAHNEGCEQNQAVHGDQVRLTLSSTFMVLFSETMPAIATEKWTEDIVRVMRSVRIKCAQLTGFEHCKTGLHEKDEDCSKQ
jgi:hypothetical protein